MEVELVKLLDKQLTLSELSDLIKYELGCSNPTYFGCVKSGGLKLQQNPSEFAQLLVLIKDVIKPQSYLELGIGNGGSWLLMTHYIKSIKKSVAVDNLAYGDLIGQSLEEVEEIERFLSLDSLKRKLEATFYYKSTKQFFLLDNDREFDVIFIDADHSYEGAKFDFENSLNLVNNGGYIIFHDIVSKGAPGVVQLWNEIKDKYEWSREFIASQTCGIGVIRIDL